MRSSHFIWSSAARRELALSPGSMPQAMAMLALLVLGMFGCAKETTLAEIRAARPVHPAAEHGEGDEANPLLTTLENRNDLTPSERAAAREILGELADGDPPALRPSRGLRWSDVPRALARAVNEEGVEMTILRTEKSEDGRAYSFTLRTIEDRPGLLIVQRTNDDRVYEVVHVHIGMFDNDQARAEALIDAFHDWMTAYGRRRGFDDRAR